MGKIPDRWLKYEPAGKVISGTRLFAFKCPLSPDTFERQVLPEEQRFTPDILLELIPNLGMVIDLTNTTKYYNPNLFITNGIEYCKIYVEGHVLPTINNIKTFKQTVDNFLTDNQDNDKVIGVHCTHGVNRTGFMICEYLVSQHKWSAEEAFTKFYAARGYPIERHNYINYIKKIDKSMHIDYIFDPISMDMNNSKGTQTSKGFWIDESSVNYDKKRTKEGDTSLDGVVHVNSSNLIPDGEGGFFVHVFQDDIITRNAKRGHFDVVQHTDGSQIGRNFRQNNYNSNKYTNLRIGNGSYGGRNHNNNNFFNYGNSAYFANNNFLPENENNDYNDVEQQNHKKKKSEFNDYQVVQRKKKR